MSKIRLCILGCVNDTVWKHSLAGETHALEQHRTTNLFDTFWSLWILIYKNKNHPSCFGLCYIFYCTARAQGWQDDFLHLRIWVSFPTEKGWRVLNCLLYITRTVKLSFTNLKLEWFISWTGRANKRSEKKK